MSRNQYPGRSNRNSNQSQYGQNSRSASPWNDRGTDREGQNSQSDNSSDWQAWGVRTDNYRNSELPDSGIENERMSYAQNQGYGRSNDNDSNYRAGLSEFERGRKSSRDYDSNYTGYRSTNDAEDVGHEREVRRNRSIHEPIAHGADYGSVANYSRRETARNERMDQQGSTGTSYDGRMQGYRSEFARQTTSHAGKGPKGWKRTDERIHEDVAQALELDHYIDASQLELSVNDGIVTLSGHVESRPTKRHAEDIVENISGVRDVRNQLTVDRSLFQQAKDFIMGENELPLATEKKAASKTVPRH